MINIKKIVIRNFGSAIAGASVQTLAGVAAFALTVVTLAAVSAGPDVPDFREYAAGPERKAAFLSYARPLIEAENNRIREDRKRLATMTAGDIGWFDRRWLAALAERYGLEAASTDDELLSALRRRVDVVPTSLALAQAAKESGWGTSRFARRGHNWFGEWCFEPGCGIVPAARPAHATHEVRAFDSPRGSVQSYLRNLNTHTSYRELRRARAAARRDGRSPSGLRLAEFLSRYSERGDDYVQEIRQLIRYNRLEPD